MTENASGNLPFGDVDRLADQVMDLTDTPGSVDLVLGSPTRRHRPWGPPVIRSAGPLQDVAGRAPSPHPPTSGRPTPSRGADDDGVIGLPPHRVRDVPGNRRPR